MAGVWSPLPGFTLPSHLHKQPDQIHVDVVVAGTDTVFLNESMLCQLLQIPRRCLPCLKVQVFLDVCDLRVGTPEEIVEQILAVEPGKFGSHAVLDRCHLAVDAVNQFQRHCGRLSNGIEHEGDPVLPVASGPHRLQESVILRFIVCDVARQVEDGNVQKSRADQVEHVQDVPDAAVAIREGVNAFKPVMDERHFDQWIKVTLAVIVDEALKCGHLVNDHNGILWRYKDRFAGALVFQHCPGDLAESVAFSFEEAIDLNECVVGDQPGRIETLKTQLDGLPVKRHFLGRRRLGTIREQIGLEELILGGDDFSISDETLASCRARVLVRMPWLGMLRACPLRVAKARLARLSALSTGTVSRSSAGGKRGMGSLECTTRGLVC